MSCFFILRHSIIIFATVWLLGLNAIGRADDSTNRWIATGPEKSDIQFLAIDPTNPQILYAGTFSGGVFKSTNAGDNWQVINTGFRQFYSVVSLIIDPSDPQTVYAAANGLGDLTTGTIFKSTNGGASWTQSSANSGLPYFTEGPNKGLPSSVVNVLAMDPTNPQTLYVGVSVRTTSQLSVPGQQILSRRIFKTTDGGNQWSPMSDGIPEDSADTQALVVDPTNPQTVYAGTTAGIYKSTNGGGNWAPANEGLFDLFVNSLVIDSRNPLILYAATFNGIFKTTNGGASWTFMNTGLPTFPGVTALVIDPQNSQVVYAGAFGGVFKSTDGGAHWTFMETGLPATFVQALALDPQNPLVLYAGTFGGNANDLNSGVFKSVDGGADWTPKNVGLTSTIINALAVSQADPRVLYGSSDVTLFKSTDSGASWTTIGTELPPFSLTTAFAIDPNDSNIIYTGGTANLFVVGQDSSNILRGVFKSRDGGMNFTQMNTGLPPRPNVSALTIDPANPQILYVGLNASLDDAGQKAGVVFKSTNGGKNWHDISQGQLPLDKVTRLAVAPSNPQILYVKIPPKIFTSTDGGTRWTDISNGLPPIDFAEGALAVDPTNAQIVYVGQPGLFKSLDGGNSWTNISIPISVPIDPPFPPVSYQTMAVDPLDPQILYVGLRPGGVYKSTDRGTTWAALNTGFPGSFEAAGSTGPNWTSIDVLVIAPTSPRNIYAGTQGNGVFRIQQE